MRLLRAGLLVVLLAALVAGGCAPSALNRLDGSDDVVRRPTLGASRPPATPPRPQTPSPDQSTPDVPSACPAGDGGGGSSKIAYDDPQAQPVAMPARQRVPVRRAAPWRQRPVVRLCFDVPADRRTVRGTETVVFTPDRRTCDVIFRAWPNKPETAREGTRLVVTHAVVSGKLVKPTVEAAGAPRGVPGTLIKVPVDGCVAPGRSVQIDLAFTLTLAVDSEERVGFSTGDRTTWLATAFPLLAWERGRGWATDPAVDLFGETATSEEFRLDALDVVAPRGDVVLGTGRRVSSRAGPRPGTVIHRFRADSVRDVAVAVGRFRMTEREVDGVRIHIGVPRGVPLRAPVDIWADQIVDAVRELSGYLGPFPYDDLWVAIVPDIPTGIEFPGAIQFGNVDVRLYPQLVPHEVAHMWFYGLVGNNQARDPWLDEAFAEYAEVLANGTVSESLRFRVPPPVRNRVGQTMQWYAELGQPDFYGAGVYRQGGAMLHRARRAVGPATFDRLLRDYIDANAHQIATDDDVVQAFRSEPRVIEILRRHGALVP